MAVRRRRHSTVRPSTRSVDGSLLEQIWNHSLDAMALSDQYGQTAQLTESIQQLLEEVSQRAQIEHDLQTIVGPNQARQS